MSETKCPKCHESFLFLTIVHTYVFAIKEIGVTDVIPGEKMDAEGTKALVCMKCGWQGWTDDYLEVKEGVIPLFSNPLEGKYEKLD